jgi:hypothetical protein
MEQSLSGLRADFYWGPEQIGLITGAAIKQFALEVGRVSGGFSKNCRQSGDAGLGKVEWITVFWRRKIDGITWTPDKFAFVFINFLMMT